MVPHRHACCSNLRVEALNTYGLTHVIPTGSACVQALERGRGTRRELHCWTARHNRWNNMACHCYIGKKVVYTPQRHPGWCPSSLLLPHQLVNNIDTFTLKDTCPTSKGILHTKRHTHTHTDRCLQRNTPGTQVTSTLVHQNREETHIWNFPSYRVCMTVDRRGTNDCVAIFGTTQWPLRYCKSVLLGFFFS